MLGLLFSSSYPSGSWRKLGCSRSHQPIFAELKTVNKGPSFTTNILAMHALEETDARLVSDFAATGFAHCHPGLLIGICSAVARNSHCRRTVRFQLAVNPVTNKIYVNITDNDLVTVIDGSTWSTTNVAVGLNPAAIGVHSATNKIYSSSGAEVTVTVIDGQPSRRPALMPDNTPITWWWTRQETRSTSALNTPLP